MAGWNLKYGVITDYCCSDDCLWSLFNHVFSDSSRKRNTYKFGFIKALLDNLFNGFNTAEGLFLSYGQIFGRFTENYWNLVVRYNLRQMRSDGRSEFSRLEIILNEAVGSNPVCAFLEFDSLDFIRKTEIIGKVADECRKYVIGALYEDFDGVIYSFDLNGSGLTVNRCVYEFMLRHKSELEKLNYYAWAKFLEKINSGNAAVYLLDKLEAATPRRGDLSVYQVILRKEFEENNCFYCGKKLGGRVHVDHFIPWSFVRDDKLWNFVLACPSCNEKKNNRLPKHDLLIRIEERNRTIMQSDDSLVQKDFENYSDDLPSRIWKYAKLSGLKEFQDNSRSA